MSEGEVFKKIRQAEGEALQIRSDNVKAAYEDLKTNGLAFTAVKDKLFVQYMMVIAPSYLLLRLSNSDREARQST